MQKIFQTENNRNNTEIKRERVNEKLFRTQLCVMYYFSHSSYSLRLQIRPRNKTHHKQKEKKRKP